MARECISFMETPRLNCALSTAPFLVTFVDILEGSVRIMQRASVERKMIILKLTFSESLYDLFRVDLVSLLLDATRSIFKNDNCRRLKNCLVNV